MTIRIYPSRIPGAPLETHEQQYFAASMDDQKCSRYSQDRSHPIAVELNGRQLSPDEWPLCQLSPDSDIQNFTLFLMERGWKLPSGYLLRFPAASAAYSLFFRAESRSRWLFIGEWPLT